MKKPTLQPLRIPSGWLVNFNELLDVDISDNNYEEGFLKEDLLQIKHIETNVLIDVGWYGGPPPEGAFGIHVHKNDFRGLLLENHQLKNKSSMVELIENLLQRYSNYG